MRGNPGQINKGHLSSPQRKEEGMHKPERNHWSGVLGAPSKLAKQVSHQRLKQNCLSFFSHIFPLLFLHSIFTKFQETQDFCHSVPSLNSQNKWVLANVSGWRKQLQPFNNSRHSSAACEMSFRLPGCWTKALWLVHHGCDRHKTTGSGSTELKGDDWKQSVCMDEGGRERERVVKHLTMSQRL